MGCGQKAWAEKEEEEAYAKKLAKFQSYSDHTVMSKISAALSDLQSLSSDSSVALTRRQWRLLEDAIICLRDIS